MLNAEIGAWQGRFANDQGWTWLNPTGNPYEQEGNVFGEPIAIRSALRIVDHFAMQLREQDDWATGAADLSGGAYFYPATPGETLGAGAPDAATDNKFMPVLIQSGSALYLDTDEGKYVARVNRTAGLLAHFCIHGAHQCGKTEKYCCENTSFVCLDKPPAPGLGGYCQ